MGRTTGSLVAMAAMAGVLAFGSGAQAQAPAPAPAENAAPTADNALLLAIFLKHDQSRPLSELNAQAEKQGFYKAFPPAGIEVVSWHVMMGIGQVVTLRLPASRLREVKSHFRNQRLGQLSYRILCDLRLQGDRSGRARKGAGEIGRAACCDLAIAICPIKKPAGRTGGLVCYPAQTAQPTSEIPVHPR